MNNWQFSLQSLFLSMVVLASSMGAFGGWGIAATIFVLAVAVCVRTANSAGQALLRVGCLFLSILVVAMLLPLYSKAREPARRAQCLNRLHQIGFGLLNYEDANGRFPPPYTADAQGRPVHSWRALILPYIDPSYTQYNFNEPWDGPNNRKLAKQMPSVYGCWSHSEGTKPGTTHYIAVTGPNTAWRQSKATSAAGIADGAANTIMVVEVPDSDINWLEPRDLTLDEAIDKLCSPSASDTWKHRPAAVFADGRARRLPSNLSKDDLKTLLTIDGGESVDVNWSNPRDRQEPNWDTAVGVAIFLLSAGLLIFRPRRKGQEPVAEETVLGDPEDGS